MFSQRPSPSIAVLSNAKTTDSFYALINSDTDNVGGKDHFSDSNTYRIYMMTPRLHMSQLVSYFSGPKTSGAETADSV